MVIKFGRGEAIFILLLPLSFTAHTAYGNGDIHVGMSRVGSMFRKMHFVYGEP
jgi:hypothetical protein